MRINRATLDALEDLFINSNCIDNSPRTPNNGGLNYSNNNVFNLFLHIDSTKPDIKVPLICRKYFEKDFYHDHITEFNMALYAGGASFSGRAANSIFKAFSKILPSYRLAKTITSKGEVYYGGYGIILDKDMKPLLLCTIEGDRENEYKITYTSAKVYVSPSVFLSEGLLEKGILKTVIPAYVDNDVAIYTSWSNTTRNFKSKGSDTVPEIIVKDFTDDFFIKPSKPIPNSFTKEKVNEFLLGHIEDIKSLTML